MPIRVFDCNVSPPYERFATPVEMNMIDGIVHNRRAQFERSLDQSPTSLGVRHLDGRTWWHLAVEKNRPDLLRILHERSSLTETWSDVYGDLPASLAIRLGFAPLLKIFLEQGLNPNLRFPTADWYRPTVHHRTLDVKGMTLLHVASQYRQTASVKALMEHGAEVNAVNSRGETALLLAAAPTFAPSSNGRVKGKDLSGAALQALLDAGACTHHQDDHGQDALARLHAHALPHDQRWTAWAEHERRTLQAVNRPLLSGFSLRPRL